MERRRGEWAWVVGLAALVLLAFLSRYPLRDFRLPMGPDAPVYMWWAHLAQLDGLSVANWRPGTPALSLMLGESLGLTQLQVAAGLGAVFAATIGLAAYAAVRAQTTVWTALLAGALTGAYASHLAGGYFGNIIIAAMLMAVAAVLGNASRVTRARAAAIALLAAGGLAHPMFLMVSIAVLALAIPMAPKRERASLWITGGGAGALAGLGLLSMFAGPRPLSVDTSADAFMRRAGLADALTDQFRSRLAHHIARYVPWLMLPLAWLGRKGSRGLTRALLEAWAWLCLAGVAASFIIGSIPGVRMIAYAFPLAVFAALGVTWLARKVPSRAGSAALAVALIAIMIAGGGLTWARERPYADPLTVDQVQRAGAMIERLPAGTPLIFVVDEARADLAAYRTTNWGNILRAYLPADRIANVNIYYGSAYDLVAGRPTSAGEPVQQALSRTYWDDLQGTDLGAAAIYRLSSMTHDAWTPVDGVTDVLTEDWPAASQTHTQLPSSSRLVWSGVAMFLALAVVGLGWARAVMRETNIALALSPAFGAGALILSGVLLDRLGVRLDGAVVPVAGVTIGVVGYVAAWFSHRKVETSTLADPPV